jgi:hypothetical protein
MKRFEPIREIQFAAKSGFLTKDLWNEFFARGSLSWRYKVWNSFTEQKIFFPHYAKFASSTLILNRKHRLVQNIVGEELVSAPFVSQLDHDEQLARIVLGILKDGVATNYRLEPELKRLATGFSRHYESSQKDKYPDALLQLANEKKTRVAIELELTKKDPKRYRQIMDAYSSYKRADTVVFIVRTDRISQAIKQAMRDSYYPDWERPIGFGRLDDWRQTPALAQISFKDEVKSLSEMANLNTQKVA